MKLRFKKDIVIPKGIVFDKMPNDSIPFYRYDTLLDLDNTYLRIVVSKKNKKYFKVVE